MYPREKNPAPINDYLKIFFFISSYFTVAVSKPCLSIIRFAMLESSSKLRSSSGSSLLEGGAASAAFGTTRRVRNVQHVGCGLRVRAEGFENVFKDTRAITQ